MPEKIGQLKIEKDRFGKKENLRKDPDYLRKKFKAANEHRDYSIYERSMDAALLDKALSIFPHFNIEEGDIIVDAGSGTGALAELAAKEFRGAKVYALDISHELLEQAQKGKVLAHLVFGSAAEQNFPDNSVKVKYYSTSGHEIESFGGKGAMRRAMENTLRELAPGGRVVIRDFAKCSGANPIYMRILSNVGMESLPAGIGNEDIDYSLLSAPLLLERFQKEFQGGDVFSFEKVFINGREFIKIDPEWAHEFYLRKDYTANWRQEIKEKYTYWTPEEAKKALEEAGFVNVKVVPDPNEWILKNRLDGKIELFEMKNNGELARITFPMTHMVVVGEKSGEKPQKEMEPPRGVDYKKLLSTIEFDRKRHAVTIGYREFLVGSSKPLAGTKKLVFRLHGEPRLLKIVRPDTRNDHNVFRAMFQTVEREEILDKFNVPHLKITEHDPEGPPYRFVIQETVPSGSRSAADLILSGEITEDDIKQMAEIVGRFEKTKEWQLDTNPFNWFKVPKEDGSRQMMYTDCKVYRYDEQWEFSRIGLLQWIDPRYIKRGSNFSAAIPSVKEYKNFKRRWRRGSKAIEIWKRHLDIALHP